MAQIKLDYKSQADVKELNAKLAEELRTGCLVLVAKTSTTQKVLKSEVWASFCCVAIAGT